MKPFEKYVKIEEEKYLTLLEKEKRLNKALEYIREKSILCDKWVEVEPLQFVPLGIIEYKSLNKKNVEELIKILKGEE